MAPKSSSLSHLPSKDEDEREESSSGEEEEEEEASEPQSSKEDSSDDDSTDDEIGNQRTLALGSLRSPISAPKFDVRSNSRRSELDSDADSDGSPSNYRLQPIAAKSKRGRDEVQEDSMRSCKSSRGEEKKSSPGVGLGCINRLWSFEDEKAVLDGMIEFKSARGFDPTADMGAFHGFIKGKLKVDFTKDQLRTKVTGMKKRFLNAVKKAENGSDPVFSKPHEDMAFVLSKRIWGEREKAEKSQREFEERGKDSEGGDFWSKYPNINASFDNVRANFPSLVAPVAGMSLLKEKLSLIGNVKAKELDNKWKQLYVEECQLSYKTLVLMKEQVEMALDQ